MFTTVQVEECLSNVLVQWNPVISNPGYDQHPTMLNCIPFHLVLLLVFSHLLLAISNSGISDTPLSRTEFGFPWPKLRPFTSNFTDYFDRVTTGSRT